MRPFLSRMVANVLRGMIEVTCEFHFLVANGSDFGDSAREIGLHEVANGVELDANFFDLVSGGESGGWERGEYSCCD